MPRRGLAPTLVVAAAALIAAPALASDPTSDAVTAPAPAQPAATAAWTGTIGPGLGPLGAGSCDLAPGADAHTTTIAVPAGHGGSATTVTFTVAWTDAHNDERLEVVSPDGVAHVSDTSTSMQLEEAVRLVDPPAGDYTVKACPSLITTNQDYTGRVTLENTAPAPDPTASSAATPPPAPPPPPTTTTPPPATGPPPSAPPRSRAQLQVTSVVRRGSRLRVTLRTSNGAIRGARIGVTRDRRPVAAGTSGRIGVAGVTLTLRTVRGAQLVQGGRLLPGTYRIIAVAVGASKARTGGVILLN